jgi:hypothetical protein
MKRSVQRERNGEIMGERQPGHDGQQNAENTEQQEMSPVEKVTRGSERSFLANCYVALRSELCRSEYPTIAANRPSN